MVIDDKLKSDHLFLLVGTNPLPNYVAAKLLLKPNGKIYLVHSKAKADKQQSTAETAKRLATLLKIQPIKIEVEEFNADQIFTKIEEKASKLEGQLGLHYTGGTKVMAVHAHRALSAKKAICSYLDARSYEMRFDSYDGNYPPAKKILLEVNLGLKELLELHDIKLTHDSLVQTAALVEVAQDLAQLHVNDSELWVKWRYQEFKINRLKLEKAIRMGNGYRNWISETELSTKVLTWPKDNVLQPIIKKMMNALGENFSPQFKLGRVVPKGLFTEISHFLEWLDGKWLEHFVFEQIRQVDSKPPLLNFAMNLNTVMSDEKPNFELDIGVMRGYQLFGISCTSDPDLAKQKLFEAYIRARQLGGDEARAAVVCPHKYPGTVQKEVEYDAPNKVRVFGAEHLHNPEKLRQELKKWFETAN